MNCELVEEQLSAYHDHALDARTADQVGHHVATCAHCTAILADYARFDQLLATAPRVAPGPELHDRIFASPEFRELLQGTKTPTAPIPNGARVPPPSARLHPQAMRTFAQVLAVVVLLSGATLAISRILASRASDQAFAACPTALSAGPHLVFQANGTLMSGDAKLVCDPRTQVGALWQVSPDGHWIAYVNTATNTLRLVRADATQDHAISTGTGQIQKLIWSSDSQTLLVAQTDGQHPEKTNLWRVAKDAAQAQLVTALIGFQMTADPIFSPDGQAIAVGTATASGNGYALDVFPTFGTPRSQLTPVAGHVEAANLGSITLTAPVVALGWTNAADPRLTWTTRAPYQTGLQFGSVQRSALRSQGTVVTTSDAHPTAAVFSSSSGLWAAAQADGTVIELDPATWQSTSLARIGPVSALRWSPDGRTLAVSSGTTLWLLTPSGATKIGTQVNNASIAWNTDNSAVAFAQGTNVFIDTLATGKITTAASFGAGPIVGLRWSLDAHRLAIWGRAGIALTNPAGMPIGTLPGATSTAPQWSVAGG